jgi:hypothetical protein
MLAPQYRTDFHETSRAVEHNAPKSIAKTIDGIAYIGAQIAAHANQCC